MIIICFRQICRSKHECLHPKYIPLPKPQRFPRVCPRRQPHFLEPHHVSDFRLEFHSTCRRRPIWSSMSTFHGPLGWRRKTPMDTRLEHHSCNGKLDGAKGLPSRPRFSWVGWHAMCLFAREGNIGGALESEEEVEGVWDGCSVGWYIFLGFSEKFPAPYARCSVQLDTEMHQPYLGLLSNYRINSIRWDSIELWSNRIG